MPAAAVAASLVVAAATTVGSNNNKVGKTHVGKGKMPGETGHLASCVCVCVCVRVPAKQRRSNPDPHRMRGWLAWVAAASQVSGITRSGLCPVVWLMKNEPECDLDGLANERRLAATASTRRRRRTGRQTCSVVTVFLSSTPATDAGLLPSGDRDNLIEKHSSHLGHRDDKLQVVWTAKTKVVIWQQITNIFLLYQQYIQYCSSIYSVTFSFQFIFAGFLKQYHAQDAILRGVNEGKPGE